MKNRNLICKLVFFTAILALLLSLAACALAEGTGTCPDYQHVGPFSYRNKVNATCTIDGHQDKYCDNCGKFIGTEPIIAIGHKYETRTEVRIKPTCTDKGLNQEISQCKVCGAIESTKDIDVDPLGHDYGPWQVTKQPTCEGKGLKVRICSRDSSHQLSEEIDPIGHAYGPFSVTKQPTCTDSGLKVSICANDPSHKKEESIDPIGHKWDGGKVTKQPDCTNTGLRVYTCLNDPSHTKSETIPIEPDAHKWDNGKVTKKPTCTTPGVRTYTCQLNPAHTYTEAIAIDPDAHDWGPATVTKQPTCDEPGEKTIVCNLNPAHKKTESIPATGHKWDKGTVIKKPTLTEEGQKKYVCENDPSHTYIENLGRLTMGNNTVCAFGPRLRDTNLYPYDTDLWYMFTPFDASTDGVQTYELVASNMFIVGSVTLTIKDGYLTIDYTLADTRNFNIDLEFFTVLNKIGDITKYEPEDLLYMRWNKKQAYNLAENFGEDTSLVLYFCSRCTYTYSEKYVALNYESQAHQRLLKSMRDLMD